MIKNKEKQAIVFCEYDNDSLCIKVINEFYEVVVTCTEQTDAIEDFEEVRGLSENKNNELRGMHRYNLIVAIDKDNELALSILRQNNIIQPLPEYVEKAEDKWLAFYKLTEFVIDQKCQIIDFDYYQQANIDVLNEVFAGLPFTDLIYRFEGGYVDFAAIRFEGNDSYFVHGNIAASQLDDIQEYLIDTDNQCDYEFHGSANEVYEKLSLLRRIVNQKGGM